MAWRDRLESGFETWGRAVVRHRTLALLASGTLAALLGLQLPRMETENSIESLLRDGDPDLVRFVETRDLFDQGARLNLVIRTSDPFDLGFLERLRALHHQLEHEVPHVEEVESLLNARVTRGEGDELVVEELFERWPRSEAELEAIRRRALANPLYRDTLLSRDGHFTVVSLRRAIHSELEPAGGGDEAHLLSDFGDGLPPDARPYITRREKRAVYDAVRRVADRNQATDFEIHLVGEPVTSRTVIRALERDVQRFIGGAVLAIAVLLGLLFRRLSAVVLPILVVVASLLSTLGCMVLLGIPLSAPLQVIPPLLLTVGVCDAVHVLTIMNRRCLHGDGRTDAIARALGHSALAVLLTSLTTAAGLASFVVAEVTPVVHFGIVGPIGVLFALFYTLVALPALLACVPLRARPLDAWTGRWLGHRLADMAAWANARPGPVLAATGALVAAALIGAQELRFGQNLLEWLPASDPVRISTEIADGALRGATSVDVVIDTGVENGLYEPETLRRLEAAMRFAEGVESDGVRVGKATSLVDVVKEIHQALNENRPEFHALPESRELIAQELLLFENSGTDDLEPIVDSRFSLTRMRLSVPFADAFAYGPLLDRLETGIREILGDRAVVDVTGRVALFSRAYTGVITSMFRSYGVALLLIAPLLVAVSGRFDRGLVALVPNLIPVCLTLGLMGFLDIPLDMSTMMVGAIVLGIAVDDTIHFTHRLRIYAARSQDTRAAIRRTLETTGPALLFTTLLMMAGFLVVSLAYMVNFAQFGVLTCFATGTAFLSDLLVAPALLALTAGGRRATSAPATRAAPDGWRSGPSGGVEPSGAVGPGPVRAGSALARVAYRQRRRT